MRRRWLRSWTGPHPRRLHTVCRADRRFPLHSPTAKTDSGFMQQQTQRQLIKTNETRGKPAQQMSGRAALNPLTVHSFNSAVELFLFVSSDDFRHTNQHLCDSATHHYLSGTDLCNFNLFNLPQRHRRIHLYKLVL